MSLEERIRRFAEQARGYLLEEFARSTQKDTEVVQWQGYSEDGKLIARNKDLNPIVNGSGQKYQTKGSDLILDNTGTVEQRKAKRGQQRTAIRDINDRQINQVNRGAVITDLVPRSNIIIFEDFFEELLKEVGNFVLCFAADHQSAYIGAYTRYFKDYITVPGTYGNPNSNKPTYFFGAANLLAHARAAFTSNTYTAEVSLSGTPMDLTATSVYPNPGGGAGTRTQKSKTVVTILEDDLNYQLDASATSNFNIASLGWMVSWRYYRPPETIYYIQFGDSATPSEAHVREIDLQSYCSDTIIYFDCVHNFTRKIQTAQEEFTTTTYLIFYVVTCDFGYEELYQRDTGSNSVVEEEIRYVGKLRHYWLHLKVNLESGNVTSRATEQTHDHEGNAYDIQPYDVDDVWLYRYNTERLRRNIFGKLLAARATSGFVEPNVATVLLAENYTIPYSNYPNFQDILDQAFEGDWVYEWKTTGLNLLNDSDLKWFLGLSFIDGVWYARMNGVSHPYDITWYGPKWGGYLGGFDIWEPGLPWANNYAIGRPASTNITVEYPRLSQNIYYGERYTAEEYFTGDPGSNSNAQHTGPNIADELSVPYYIPAFTSAVSIAGHQVEQYFITFLIEELIDTP
jgi:hypothetical protein